MALVAGEDGEQEITYEDLDRRANRLAHHLRGQGVRPEMPVALSLERSPTMIVALFAILKAGGAYVPMDPALPRERLDFLLADSGVPVLVTELRLLAAYGEQSLSGVRVVCLEADRDRIAACPDSPLDPEDTEPHLERLAYVIYTSGSTGKPKGVMVSHGSLASYIAGDLLEYGIGPADRVLQFASISLDNSAEEIYPVLTTGGTLVLRSDAMMRSSADFLAACRARRITLLTLPTAFWHVLAADLTEDVDWPSGLRRVIIGGERPLPERLEVWRRHLGTRVHLWNTYGPTECTIGATIGDLLPWLGSTEGLREAPLGRPFAGYRAYLTLPALSLNGSGKVDRRALPAPDASRPALAAEYEAPASLAEKGVAAIWCKVFGIERVGILILADLVCGAAAISLAALVLLEAGRSGLILAGLLVLSAIMEACDAFFRPAISASIPDLVPEQEVTRANSANRLALDVSTFIGQGLGGVFFRVIGPGVLFLIDGITYFFSALSVAVIRLPPPPPVEKKTRWREAGADFWWEVKAGLRYVASRPGMRYILFLAPLESFFMITIVVLLPFFVEDFLHVKPDWYGFLVAAFGGGSFLGSIVAGATNLTGRLRRWTSLACAVGFGVAAISLGLAVRRGWRWGGSSRRV